jgi:hypothetical protein
MLEQIDCDRLIKGQMYCVIHNFLERKENLIFDGYSFFKYPDSNYSFQLHLSANNFYRYVSDAEYYAKLKEKYDSKCLDIVLKRLVNETFSWS